MGLSREKKRKQWKKTMQDWETSGESVLGDCREHGIPHWKLFYWKERLRKKDKRTLGENLEGGSPQYFSKV